MKEKEFTILHVEDDPNLANMVRMAFLSFGFRGSIIAAATVKDALDLLDRRQQKLESLKLILVDMNLPGGSGLDVIRKVKQDPFWRLTPTIVLSSELAPGIINSAYALGANCFFPKMAGTKGPYKSLQALYANWIEFALLPKDTAVDHLQHALSRAIHLRGRAAELYVSLARAFEGTPEANFWLDRSLNEGNLANLLAFLQPKISEKDMPEAMTEQLRAMQVQVEQALNSAENCLKKIVKPRPAEVYRLVLDITGAINEEVVAEIIGCLFPKAPEAISALKARAAIQHMELANHILERTQEPELRQQATELRARAEQFGATAPL